MRGEKIGDFLGRLAGRVPAPGGGASTADDIIARARQATAAVREQIRA
jgi:hypothetical protein